MRSRWASLVAAALLLSRPAAAGSPPPSQKSVDAAAKLARSGNAFGFDLYQRLRKTPGNLVISPESLTAALTLAWAGARGETAAEMKRVLHLQETPDQALAASGRLAASLRSPSGPVVLRIDHQLFAEKTYKLVPAFVEKTRKAFGAPVEALDLIGAPEPSRLQINQWIESRTEHRIRGLIPPGGISPSTRLVLADTIYFLGSWDAPFKVWETRPAPFYLTASRKQAVPTMKHEGFYRVGRKDGVTAVELPYKGRGLSMLLLVPDKVDGLAAIEGALGAQQLDAILAALRGTFIELAMPKFELSPGSLDLREHLKALGMGSVFRPGEADLTGIARPPKRTDRLSLDGVFHQAYVKVDEKGTEAAAATVEGAVMGMDMGTPRRIQVDRPFLFLIRDNASGTILFLGRVSDPVQGAGRRPSPPSP
jgi:serpin B